MLYLFQAPLSASMDSGSAPSQVVDLVRTARRETVKAPPDTRTLAVCCFCRQLSLFSSPAHLTSRMAPSPPPPPNAFASQSIRIPTFASPLTRAPPDSRPKTREEERLGRLKGPTQCASPSPAPAHH